MLKLYRPIILWVLMGLNVVFLAGCGLKPVKETPQQTYVLNPPLPHLQATHSSATLWVETPKATPAFDNTQMAYVNKPYQLAYFSYNQWADTPAQMLHPLLVQALQNTGHFHAVIASAYHAHYDFILSTRLLALQQVFLRPTSTVQLRLQAQLINNATQQVIATQQFTVEEPAPENTPYGGVLAANKATEEWLRQITAFCLANT